MTNHANIWRNTHAHTISNAVENTHCYFAYNQIRHKESHNGDSLAAIFEGSQLIIHVIRTCLIP